MAGETAKPGWIANVNPFVVVCCVSFVTRLMAKRSAITSMNIGMFLIPFSALLMACGNLLGNDVISGMSNITLMMIAGIVFAYIKATLSQLGRVPLRKPLRRLVFHPRLQKI